MGTLLTLDLYDPEQCLGDPLCFTCTVGVHGLGDLVYTTTFLYDDVPLAQEVDVYGPLWRPQAFGIYHAVDLVPWLVSAQHELTANARRHRKNCIADAVQYDRFAEKIGQLLTTCLERQGSMVHTF